MEPSSDSEVPFLINSDLHEKLKIPIDMTNLNGTQTSDVRMLVVEILFERLVVDLGVVDGRQRIDVLRPCRGDRVAVGVVLDVDVVVVGS